MSPKPLEKCNDANISNGGHMSRLAMCCGELSVVAGHAELEGLNAVGTFLDLSAAQRLSDVRPP